MVAINGTPAVIDAERTLIIYTAFCYPYKRPADFLVHLNLPPSPPLYPKKKDWLS